MPVLKKIKNLRINTTLFLLITVISLIFICNKVFAESKLEIPKPVGYVNDFAGVISTENKDNLNSYLKELDKKTSAEVAVVTLTSLKGNSIEDVSLGIGRNWGIGKKGKNNGVLVLVAINDKKMRIEVGYGLEGAIPDGKAGRIRNNYMIPAFRQGNYEKGIVNGTLAIASEIAKEYKVEMPDKFNSSVAELPVPSESGQRRSSGSGSFLFLIIVILLIFRRISPLSALFLGGYSNYGEGFGGGGSSGGDFGGFGGGDFGGGGASGGW